MNARAALLSTFVACSAAQAADAPARIDTIDLRQTDQSLRDTYAKNKRMGLPRLVMLDAQGRLIYGQTGVRNDLRSHLHQALDKDKPIEVPITLDAVLEEVQGRDGKPVSAATLPHGDAYVIDYWASWCAPCRMLERDLANILGAWDGKHFVWVKIESDPELLPEHGKKK